MFITKGLIKYFNPKSRKIDVNSLPDIESEPEVLQFLASIKEDIQEWNQGEELKIIIEYLLEASEKYDILTVLEPVWLKGLYNSVESEWFQSMLDITLNTSEKQPQYFNKIDFLDFCWTVIKENQLPMIKFSVLKNLQQLPQNSSLSKFLNSQPDRVNLLLDMLKDPADYLRNGNDHAEAILLIKKIGTNDEEICKLLAFQGIFETLAEIMNEEDKVIINDCFELMKILMTRFNKDYIRETRCVFRIVETVIGGDCNDCALEFIVIACTGADHGVYTANQKYFSKLASKIVLIAYSNTGKQSINALKAFELLIKSNPSEIEILTAAEFTDTIDLILTYCALEINHKENISVIWSLIDSYKRISESFISKVTCMPGYVAPNDQLPAFNYIINRLSLEDPSRIVCVARVLEIILFSNEPCKQLAAHLPIDLNSGTLLLKIFSLWTESFDYLPSSSVALSRLLITWVYESQETANKLLDLVFTSLPSILKFIKGSGINESLVALTIGLVSLACKSTELDNILMKNIGYNDFRSKLDLFSQLPEFKKAHNSSNLILIDEVLSLPLVRVYRSAVQAVIMHFVKGIAESAPEDQKELAKLFEVREAYSSMQYLRKPSHNEADNCEVSKRAQELEVQISEKNDQLDQLKLELVKTRSGCNKEVRSAVIAMINIQEKLELSEFENTSLRRENGNLNAKVQRLLEEIQTYTVKKHEVLPELKLIEAKESLRMQINENNYLRKKLEKAEKDYEEALEVIGKLEMTASRNEMMIYERELEERGYESKEPTEDIHQIYDEMTRDIEEVKETSQVFYINEPEGLKNLSESPADPPPSPFSLDPYTSSHTEALKFFENLSNPTSISSFFQ